MEKILRFDGKVREIRMMFESEGLKFISFNEKVREKVFNSVK